MICDVIEREERDREKGSGNEVETVMRVNVGIMVCEQLLFSGTTPIRCNETQVKMLQIHIRGSHYTLFLSRLHPQMLCLN